MTYYPKALTCKYMYADSGDGYIHYKCELSSPGLVLADHIDDMVKHCSKCKKYEGEEEK